MAEHDPNRPSPEDAESQQQNPPQEPIPDPHQNEPAPPPDRLTRTPEDAEVIRPDQDEDLGPIPELFGAAGKEAATVVSDDPDVEQRAIDAGAETEGVETAQIFGLLAATVMAIVVIVFAIFFLAARAGDAREARHLDDLRYPELEDMHSREQGALMGYGVVSEEEGIYRIPLLQAQRLMAEEYRQQQGAAALQAPESRAAFNLAVPQLGPRGGVTADFAPTLTSPLVEAAPEDAEVDVDLDEAGGSVPMTPTP